MLISVDYKTFWEFVDKIRKTCTMLEESHSGAEGDRNIILYYEQYLDQNGKLLAELEDENGNLTYRVCLPNSDNQG